MSHQPEPSRRWRRRLAFAALAAVVSAAALALVLHTAFVRGRVLSYALATVQQQYGLDIDAERLDYNLAALRAGLAGVRISNLSSPGEPFFEADYVSVTLPRRALLGDVSFDDISMTNALVRIVRRADGSTNLPESGEPSEAEPPPLRIARLSIADLAVEVRDESGDIDVSVPAVSVLLTPEDGRITLAQPADIRVGDRTTQLTAFDGGAAFDGRSLILTDVRLQADEASVTTSGSLRLIAADPAIVLQVEGTGDLTRLARWGLAEGELPEGSLGFGARITGAMSDPTVELDARSDRVSWQNLTVTDLSTRLGLTTSAVDVEAFDLGLEGGRVSASGSFPFDDEAAGRLDASWTGVNAASAALAAAPGTAVVPAGTVSGALEAQGPGIDLARWSGDARVQLDPARNSQGRVAAPGSSTLQLRDGTWRLDGRHTVGGVAPVTLALGGRVPDGPDGQPGREGTVQGTVQLGDTDVPALLDVLRLTGIADIAPEALTSGTLAADVRVSGALSNPAIEAQARGRDVSGQQVEVAALEAAVSGRAVPPRVDFAIDAPAAVLAGQPLHELGVAGRLMDGAVVLDSLSARQPAGPGSIAGSGTYNPATGQYMASLAATGWQIAPTADLPLSGVIAVRATGAGTTAAPHGTGEIALSDGLWQDMALGPLDASFVLDGRAASIEAHAPDFEAEASANVRLDAPYDATLDLTARGLDLARVLRDLDAPVQLVGTTTVMVHAEGPLESWRAGSASLEVASLEASTGELPIRLVQPALVRYADEGLYVDRLEAEAGDTHLSASGELPAFEAADGLPGMLVTMTGDVGAVAQAASAAGVTDVPITGGSGPVALLARVTGSMLEPVVAADLEVGPGSVTFQDMAPIADLRLRAHAEEGWVELREATASYEGALVSATGKAPLSLFTDQPGDPAFDAALHVRASNLTPVVLQAFVDAGTLEQLAGSVDATLDVSSPTIDLADVTGELRFDRLEMRVADLPVTQRVPTRLVVRDGFARIEAWDWVGQGATLDVRGQVRLSDRQSAILANGAVDLRMLTPFVREAGMTTAGRLVPRLSITGPIDNPRVDGDLTVTNGEIRLADPRLLVSDLGVRTVLTRTSATITSIAGNVNGGPLTGSGAIDYRADGRVDLQLTTDIRGMAMEFPDGLRSEVDADLQLVLGVPPEAPPSGRLSGTVTVVRGAYREPLAVVTGLLTTLRANRLAAAGGGAPVSPLLSGLALDVRLLTDEDLIVDNNYGRVQLGADLRIIGTAAAPSLSGRAELREGGQLFVGRNIYTIDSGTIDFSNPVTIEPDLNVVASTRAGGEDIEVTITGTPDAPSVVLQSSTAPELGQAEIASLLLTGRPLEDLAPGDAAFIGTQVLGNFSAEVLGFAGRVVGLDSIRLGGVDDTTSRRDPTAAATELDPTTRLTFGKSLGSNVDITFSQSLRDGDAQTWIVEYFPARALELRLVSDDEDLRSYGFLHELTFGTAAPQMLRPAAVSRQRQAANVTSVSLSGDLVFPEARVRNVVRLEPGDRFDFVEWQDDRDRLEAFYRQQGYLAARASAAREDTDAGIALAYEVTPGPPTRIAVTGMNLDSALRAQLEAAWAESVFDDFLTDEATAIVREALAGDGYLQPAVNASLADEDGTRTLSIVVEPGVRSTRTIVRVDGADRELTTRIEEWLETSALVDRAALNPGAVEDGVTAFLRGNGYLQAEVAAGAPLVEDGAALVPLRVDAGPVFQVVSLAFDGAERLDAATLRDAAGIAEGMPYDAAVQDEARLALLSLYRSEGFASPTVTPLARVHETAPAVDVVFEIDEGPRQVVGDVMVAGNRAIDPDVIVRTMELQRGAPLRAQDLLQARTRIFETGLFRRVDVSSDPAETTVDAENVPMQVRVAVEEWPALRLRYGFQVSEERPEDNPEGRALTPGLSADLVRRTLFGRAVSVGGVFEVQRREQVARAFLNAPTFVGLPIQSSLVLERSRQTFEADSFVTALTGVTWEQRTRVAGNLSLSYAYRFERNRTFDTDPDEGEPLFDLTVHVGRWTGSAAWDTRDDPADTTRGLLASSSFEFASESSGSDFRFVRQLAQVYHFRPWRNVVFASAGRLGTVTPLGGQELLRLFRFFAGGSRTVRGLPEGGLGARDFFGDPVGGQAMLVLNQEARVPIYRWVRGVAFIDAGNVFPRFDDLRLGDLVGSVGVGLRLATPFALLRADYGRVMWPGPAERSGRWSFGIGHAF